MKASIHCELPSELTKKVWDYKKSHPILGIISLTRCHPKTWVETISDWSPMTKYHGKWVSFQIRNKPIWKWCCHHLQRGQAVRSLSFTQTVNINQNYPVDSYPDFFLCLGRLKLAGRTCNDTIGASRAWIFLLGTRFCSTNCTKHKYHTVDGRILHQLIGFDRWFIMVYPIGTII